MTTNQRLRQLKDEHGLTYTQIAELTGSKPRTVKSWLWETQGRTMPAAKLELLELKLAARQAAKEQP